MKTVSTAVVHGIPQGVGTRDDRGWRVWRRGDGALVISFRVSKGKWKDRRILPAEAHTEAQGEKWARVNVARLRGEALGQAPIQAVAPAVVRVSDLEDRYLEIRGQMGLRPATLKQDASVLTAHLIPHLGRVAVVHLDLARLLDFVDALKDEGLGASTVRNVLSVLRSFLDVAKARRLAPIMANPTRDPEFVKLGRPKRVRSPKPQIAIEVAEKLLTHERIPEHWKLRILIACTGGLRDGEIAGLTWQDVDLDAAIPVMHVRQAVALVRAKDEETGPTKTEGSVRDVPIHPETAKALKAWKAAGFVEWTGKRAKPEDFVIPNEDGSGWRPHSARKLRELLTLARCAATDSGKKIDFHALRRSFATWLARAGVERAVRKLLMGHTEGDVTEEHYIERDLAMLRDAVCKIRLDLSRGKVIAIPIRITATR